MLTVDARQIDATSTLTITKGLAGSSRPHNTRDDVSHSESEKSPSPPLASGFTTTSNTESTFSTDSSSKTEHEGDSGDFSPSKSFRNRRRCSRAIAGSDSDSDVSRKISRRTSSRTFHQKSTKKKSRVEKVEELIEKETKLVEMEFNKLETNICESIQAYESKIINVSLIKQERVNINLTIATEGERTNPVYDAIDKLTNTIDTIQPNLQTVEQKYAYSMRLPLYSLARAVRTRSNIKTTEQELLFLHSTLGADQADPKKWSIIARILFIAFIALFTSIAVATLASLVYSSIWTLGISNAIHTPLYNLLITGWNSISSISSSYQCLSTLNGIANSLAIAYFLGRSRRQNILSNLEQLITPPATYTSLSSTKEASDCYCYIAILEKSIGKIKDNKLRDQLTILALDLIDQTKLINGEEANNPKFAAYLRPILFAATAFARSVVAEEKAAEDEEDGLTLMSKKKMLLFNALKGASLKPRPTEGQRGKLIDFIAPYIPTLAIIGLAIVCTIGVATLLGTSVYAFIVCSSFFNSAAVLSSEAVKKVTSFFSKSPCDKETTPNIKTDMFKGKTRELILSIEPLINQPISINTEKPIQQSKATNPAKLTKRTQQNDLWLAEKETKDTSSPQIYRRASSSHVFKFNGKKNTANRAPSVEPINRSRSPSLSN
jgi:hypothetical protein